MVSSIFLDNQLFLIYILGAIKFLSYQEKYRDGVIDVRFFKEYFIKLPIKKLNNPGNQKIILPI
jgi:hypothetical protein